MVVLYLLLQEQARKALESALGGKRNEFEKWDKEIKRREEAGGGCDAGGGGWFGSGGWFGWFSGDHFWQEAQQASLTMLGIVLMVSPCHGLFLNYLRQSLSLVCISECFFHIHSIS